MRILKVASIFNKNDPNQFLHDLRRKLNIDIEDYKHVKALHVEHLKNDRYHLRLHINNKELIEKIRNESELNRDSRSYTLRFKSFSYLFMTPEQSDEKFYIVHSNVRNDKILKIRKLDNQNILDILNKLVKLKCKEFKYVSVNNSHAFIGFNDVKEAKIVKQTLKKQKFDVGNAKSVLKVVHVDFMNRKHQKVVKHHEKAKNKYSNIRNRSFKNKQHEDNPNTKLSTSSSFVQHSQNEALNVYQNIPCQQNLNIPTLVPFNALPISRPQIITTVNRAQPTMPLNMMSYPVNMINHSIPLLNNSISNNLIHNNPHSLMYQDYNFTYYPNQFM